MKFSLHTYDIQRLIIALINSRCYFSDSVITEADYDRLEDQLTELNRLCTEENNYTLSVTVGS